MEKASNFRLNHQDFALIQQLTKSFYCTTQKIQHKKTKKIYIATTFYNDDNDNEYNDQKMKFEDLIYMLFRYQHETIICFKGFFKEDFYGEENFSIITNYAENGSLQDVLSKYLNSNNIQNFNQTKQQILLVGIARSMMLLHKYNINHGNLNTTNILFDDKYYPHLADFYKSKISNNFNIAPVFIAPELSMKKEFNEKTDVYSFGMIMFELLSIMHPKSNKIFRGRDDLKMPDYINESYQNLIKKCLSLNQEERPNFDEIFRLLAYDKNFYLESIDIDELTNYIKQITYDLIFCTTCQNRIDSNDDLLYYSGLPYHKNCIKCSVCNKKFNSKNAINDFVCIGTDLFLCQKHHKDPSSSNQLAQHQDGIIQSIIKEKFDFQFFNNHNIVNRSTEEIFIDSETIENSFQINKPYDLFIPSVTFHFDIKPEEMNYKELQKILGDNAVIIKVENGSTLLQIAFIASDYVPKVIEEFHEIIEPIKKRLKSVVGGPIVFNLIDEPIITIPDDDSIKESFNLLQNSHAIEEIDLNKVKEEVYRNLTNEKVKKKDWKYIFKNKKIYDDLDREVREQIKQNPIEIVITGQTVIVNKFLDEYKKIKGEIPKEKACELYVYHGSRLSNHQSIIKNHFIIPGQGNINQRDEGYYGNGIYATDNMFYAAAYANGEFALLSYNERAPVICCLSIHNEDFIEDMDDLYYEHEMSDEIKSKYGIHRAFVGSVTNYQPMPESGIDNSFVYGNEYVFPNKYQIIPMCSFTVKRTDHFILWKDENIENNENKYYMEVLSYKSEVNVYFMDNVDDAIELIELKKRNKFKLITNAGKDLSGRKLINDARKIVGSNFVCLVFAMNESHLDWVCKMENVLFTNDDDDFRKFAAIEMNKEEIIKFANDLAEKYCVKFKINEVSLLNFKVIRNFR